MTSYRKKWQCGQCEFGTDDINEVDLHIKIHPIKDFVTDQIPSNLTQHPCGATSSKVSDYAQIPKHSLDRLAARLSYGEKVHGRGNWKKGLADKSYLIDRLNHVICHVYALIEELERGELSSDDNAAAIMWGGMFACEATRVQFNADSKKSDSSS